MIAGIPPSISFGRASFLAVLALSAVACGPRSFAFDGDWKGKKTVVGAPGANPDVIATLRLVKLTVKDNERFDLFVDGVALSGGIAVSGNDATLNVDMIAGQDWSRNQSKPAPKFKLKAKADGSVHIFDPKGDPSQVVVLHRIATAQKDRP